MLLLMETRLFPLHAASYTPYNSLLALPRHRGKSETRMGAPYSMTQEYYRYTSGPIYDYVSCLTCRDVVPGQCWPTHADVWHAAPKKMVFHPLSITHMRS